MNCLENAANYCSVPFVNDPSTDKNEEKEQLDDDYDPNGDEPAENYDVERDNIDPDVRGVDLKSYPNINVDTLKGTSTYTTVTDNQGRKVVVQKSSIC